MIINQTGGGSGPLFVEFTLSEDFEFSGSWLTINNVKLLSGKVRGFILSVTGGYISANNLVIRIFSNPIYAESDFLASQGQLFALYYYDRGSGQVLEVIQDTNSNAWIYDDTNETLKVKVGLSGAYLPASSYRLVIW